MQMSAGRARLSAKHLAEAAGQYKCRNVLLAVEPLQICDCEKTMAEERSVIDEDGWRGGGETKPAKSSSLV